MFLCRHSGAAGDPIAMVRHVHGCGFAAAVEMLTGKTELPRAEAKPLRDQKSEAYRQKERRRAWRIWEEGYAIDPRKGGRLVRAYLEKRGIPFPGWPIPALREADRVAYWQWSKDARAFVQIHEGPAMLAAITGPDGAFIGLHRTWIDLSRPNGKAAIADPETGEILDAKKVRGSQRGGRIILRSVSRAASPPAGGWPCDGAADSGRPAVAGSPSADLVIGEGIETVLSYEALRGNGTAELWCGVNLDNIAGRAASQVPHPSATMRDRLGRERRRKVPGPEPAPDDRDCLAVPHHFATRILLGDADGDRFATQAAMIRARARLISTSGPARIDWAPDGQDFNDALRGAGRFAA